MAEMDIEKIREFFAKDKFATENGMIIEEVGEHYAKVSVELTDRHRNAVGGIMGGVYFTLADFAIAVASNWDGKDGVVSLNADMAFLAGAKGGKMYATANCVKDGRTTCYYRIDITDENGKLLNVVNVTGYKTAAR